MVNLNKSREKLIEILRNEGISDEGILQAFLAVPRERFAPEALQNQAYKNSPIPLKPGATISQPYIIAKMFEALDLQRHERVLDVGSGSGYQAALLSHLVSKVYGIEIDRDLCMSSSALLKELHYDTVEIFHGDGREGLLQYSPFDAIIVAAASSNILGKLVSQLSSPGRMILPLGTEKQELVLVTKDKNGVHTRPVCRVSFVPLV